MDNNNHNHEVNLVSETNKMLIDYLRGLIVEIDATIAKLTTNKKAILDKIDELT
jgi:hypothetical protein